MRGSLSEREEDVFLENPFAIELTMSLTLVPNTGWMDQPEGIYGKQADHHCPRSEEGGMRPRLSYTPQLEGVTLVGKSEGWAMKWFLLKMNVCNEWNLD